MSDKYNQYGGINVSWILEEDQRKVNEAAKNFAIAFDKYQNTKLQKQMEQKLEFLKQHSSSPEEYEMAKLVIQSTK